MQKLGVIGYPIKHSLSPIMQIAAIKAAGVDYNYTAYSVAPHELTVKMNFLRKEKFRGFNVTLPHKERVIPLLDEVDEDAAIIGAVNTVINTFGKLKGYNTDWLGFLLPLDLKGLSLKGTNVLLLGAGGASRAIIWGLSQKKVASLTIGTRSPQKATTLRVSFQKYIPDITVCDWLEDAFQDKLSQADFIINATPLGMYPNVNSAPPLNWQYTKPSAFVYDIIYTPPVTKFLLAAKKHGHQVQNGEMMLVGQGAASFQLWTGIQADTTKMYLALHNTLIKGGRK